MGKNGCYLVAAKKHKRELSLCDYIQRKEEVRLPKDVLYKEDDGDGHLHKSGKDI
jgi:hypothetical protein